MPKVENPITGKKIELTNWKGLVGMVGGVILICGVLAFGYWAYTKIKGLAGVPQTGSGLGDLLARV